MSFEIKLPIFEGPFDLLLFFIQRDELNIKDIPIAKITDDFLDYLHQLEQMNIEVASEFILVAAKLMQIKSRMLLPRPTLDEEGNIIDPREELVKGVLLEIEKKKIKSVLEPMGQLENDRLEQESRGNVTREIKKLAAINDVEMELQHVDLYKLLKVYQRVMERHEVEKQRVTHEVVQYPYTISKQRDFIMDQVAGKKRVSFADLIVMENSKIAVIFNFLAILELLQLGQLNIHVGMGFNNFWVEKSEEALVS